MCDLETEAENMTLKTGLMGATFPTNIQRQPQITGAYASMINNDLEEDFSN